MEIRRRFFEHSPSSYFLFGPRGTGKSTWLRQAHPDALWIDLLEPETFRRFKARPERLIEIVRGAVPVETVVVDEVQKVPELLDAVHLLMEELPGTNFVLTGSSARKLKRAGVDLLAGRAHLRTMHPFIAGEMGKRFRLDEALVRGTLPVVVSSTDPDATLRGYASLYLREEVQAEGLVRNVGNFARFLEAVSFSHGALLNISNVARECQVERRVVQGYVEVLEDLLLAHRVPVFARRARRAVATHPKLYLFDAGVFRSLRPAGPLDRPAEIDGAALEGLVAQHLMAWIGYRDGRDGLFHWRTRAGSEVDFVVYGPETFCAIEVKNTARLRPADLRPLRTFGADYPEASRLLLYRGSERLVRGGVHVEPCARFLSRIRPNRPLLLP